ncbi:MAG: hypothetical protein MI757_02095 [Pirellulales bacterium]|nr:hypothetical protein [Pirellulales bacterium]
MPRRQLAMVVLTVFVLSTTGCQFMRRPWSPPAPMPPPISTQPTVDQIIANVNDNTARIQSINTNRATLSVSGYPSLRADLAVQQPQRMRLRATVLGSTEVDLGSNDELFWVWIKRNTPPAVYYARHNELAGAPQASIPIEPKWLTEAIGLVYFDPNHRHSGPFVRRQGQLEIRSAIPGPNGERTKVTVIDGRYGWVLEQHLYDASGKRLASAVASGHKFDPATQTSLPRQVKMQWPAAAMSITLTLNDVRINQLGADSNNLWVIPEMPGTNYVNLAETPPPTANPPQPAPVASPESPPIRASAYGGRTRRY